MVVLDRTLVASILSMKKTTSLRSTFKIDPHVEDSSVGSWCRGVPVFVTLSCHLSHVKLSLVCRLLASQIKNLLSLAHHMYLEEASKDVCECCDNRTALGLVMAGKDNRTDKGRNDLTKSQGPSPQPRVLPLCFNHCRLWHFGQRAEESNKK